MNSILRNRTILFILGIITLVSLDIWGSSYLVSWREIFWDNVKNVNTPGFWANIKIFSLVAIGLTLASGYLGYLSNLLTIRLRENRVHKLLANIDKIDTSVDNYQQRIEMDTWEYYNLGIGLLVGLSKSAVVFIVFLILLVGMIDSGTTLAVVFSYVILSTVLARLIARPLIKLNYALQQLAASFRKSLDLGTFKALNDISRRWAKGTKFISLFQALFSQISVILPYLILAPIYFSHGMTFGMLMAVGSLIGNLIQEAGYIIGQQDVINRFHSSRIRLKELVK